MDEHTEKCTVGGLAIGMVDGQQQNGIHEKKIVSLNNALVRREVAIITSVLEFTLIGLYFFVCMLVLIH